MQLTLPHYDRAGTWVNPLKHQLLKWIGNKQRFAKEIVSYFPETFGTYFEPFLGSGAILATLAPMRGMGSDAFEPLIEIWRALREDPELLKSWYADRWRKMMKDDKQRVYEKIKSSYNACPNGADLVFLSRSCYGGVVRFRQLDGYMSTPCGVHTPIHPDRFALRVDEWHDRTAGCHFAVMNYEEAMEHAGAGDLIYCDPPYSNSQRILYGAQSFSLENLFEIIERSKRKGARVVLSIDGTKKSGNLICDLPIPKGLFEHEVFIGCGRSMLKRFQMAGRSLESEIVSDRLLLTY